jgi:hypothetical protein
MLFLRQSTASQEVLLGPFLDSTDGVTAEVALTIANTDIKLWVEGATTEASKTSGGATHIASGRYYAVLDATDTATVGKLEINVHVAGALPVRREFHVLEEAVYDAMFAASAAGYQVPIWSAANSTVNLSGTTIKTATDVETDTANIQSRIPAALSDGRMPADTQALGGNTGGIANLSGFGINGYDPALNRVLRVASTDSAEALGTQAKTDVNGEVAAALTTYDAITQADLEARTLPSADYATETLLSHVNDVADAIQLKTDSLPASPAATGDIPSAATNASAVRTELGTELGRIDAAVSTRATPAQVAAELATYDGPTNAEMVARTLAASHYATAANLATVDTVADGIKAKTDQLVFTVANQVDANALTGGGSLTQGQIEDIAEEVVTQVNATGIVLQDASITSAKFSVASITGPASGILERITQLWRSRYKKTTTTGTTSSGERKEYADDGTTVIVTQAWSDNGTTSTQNTAT